MSSIDMPDKTLAALVERSWSDLTESRSIGSGFGRSVEERCEEGGEKGGGTAYCCWASMALAALICGVRLFFFHVSAKLRRRVRNRATG